MTGFRVFKDKEWVTTLQPEVMRACPEGSTSLNWLKTYNAIAADFWNKLNKQQKSEYYATAKALNSGKASAEAKAM